MVWGYTYVDSKIIILPYPVYITDGRKQRSVFLYVDTYFENTFIWQVQYWANMWRSALGLNMAHLSAQGGTRSVWGIRGEFKKISVPQ